MMVEVIRLVADALADASTGVNAQIATLPLRSGESAPTLIASIVDETRTGWVARGEFPRDSLASGPVLAVYQAGDVSMDGERTATHRDVVLDIGVRLIAPAELSESGTTQLLDTLRAVQRALRVMLSDAQQIALRTENSVQIQVAEVWRQTPIVAVEDDAIVTASLLATLNVRDQAPGV